MSISFRNFVQKYKNYIHSANVCLKRALLILNLKYINHLNHIINIFVLYTCKFQHLSVENNLFSTYKIYTRLEDIFTISIPFRPTHIQTQTHNTMKHTIQLYEISEKQFYSLDNSS